MKTDEKRTALCPKCGQEYFGRPALSRFFPDTFVCPDCGTREALDSIGICKAEQDEILEESTGTSVKNKPEKRSTLPFLGRFKHHRKTTP